MSYSSILTINTNQMDNIYVVGDLHGCYSLLMQELQNINFDFQNDVLICTGDLVDRGAENERLKNSGNLIAFEYRDTRWQLEPKTAFYDGIYLNALNLNDDLKQQALAYDAFTDIEFNPQKSINCQAYSIALFVALTKRNLLVDGVIPPKEEFIKLVEKFTIKNTSDGLLL